MGGDYRLVSEEDWQNLNEALAQAKREAGCYFIGQHDWQIRSEHYERKLQQALGELEDRKKDVLFWQSEAERARLETENLTNDLFNLRWQYSHVDPNADEPIGFNDCPCDEPKPAGRWTSDREWEADPAPCGCDPDSRILCDRHFREDFCESDPEPCDGCAVDYVYASPQRPHESLVWAIYHAALAASPRDRNGRTPAEHADEALVAWRDRWPEDEA